MSLAVKYRNALRGVALGLAATMLALAVHWAGALDWVELVLLDVRFRNLPTIHASPQIVHVDIDDPAIEQVGRWPWPRRELAELIDVLTECNARAIGLDVILPDPSPPRFVQEGATNLYVDDDAAVLAEAPPLPVLDDLELAEALARSPNLYQAVHVDLRDQAWVQTKDTRRRNPLTTRPALTREEFLRELHFEQRPESQPVWTAFRHEAYERLVREMLTTRPSLSRHQASLDLLRADDPRSENGEVLRQVYLYRRGLAETRRLAVTIGAAVFSSNSPIKLHSGQAVPPLVTLAQSVGRGGFVTAYFDRDAKERRIPLLALTDAGVLPQLALAMARDELAKTHGGCAISTAPGQVILSCADGFVRTIPVDEQAHMLINWADGQLGGAAVRHVSIANLAQVWQARRQLQRNADMRRRVCLDIVRLLARDDNTVAEADLLKLFAEADRLAAQLDQLRFQRQRALLYEPDKARPIPPELIQQQAQLEKDIDARCAKLLEEVDSFYLAGAQATDNTPKQKTLGGGTQLATQPASSTAEDPPAAQLRKLRWLRQLIVGVDQERPRLEAQLGSSLAATRAVVTDKICFVGSSATAAADFVPTPVQQRTPGVCVHSNILNTILTGKFVRPSRPWVSALLVVLCGLLVSLVTSTRGPVASGAVLVTAGILYAAVCGAVVWKQSVYWMMLAAPAGAMVLSFGVITAFRQMTEQRHRRQITNTFKQYLSPAMVDRLVDDPRRANLGGERRELSCLFSDLAGFTSISERLGPERTVQLLNRYLDGVGEFLQQRHGGTVSKYEGDGIFTFFGAPIPQADHAARAIRAALDCQAFLPDFNRRLAAEGLLAEGASLAARFGITSGEVFVGNMGSTRRIAYTAIGDAVNLASRLESANKFFGTRILVNEQAWRQGGQGIVGRPMGSIIVVGKSEPVSVWEPLSPADATTAELRELAEQFARGVELYAAGKFAQAAELFDRLAKERDDKPSAVYARLCQSALADKAESFDGVIRLAEK